MQCQKGGNSMQYSSTSDQLFFLTTKIDTFRSDGQQGSGTGFFFEYKAGGRSAMFLVTNKHVVDGSVSGAFYLHKRMDNSSPELGTIQRFEVESFRDMWFDHPSCEVDITVCPIQLLMSKVPPERAFQPFLKSISNELIASPETERDFDSEESIVFVGYPNGIFDTKNFLPVMRRGTTATPIELDFENTPRFLIDASVFGGSSGSPVFLHDRGWHLARTGTLNVQARFHFIGVVSSVYFRRNVNEVFEGPIPTMNRPLVEYQEMIDLGIVVKARTVVETIRAFLTFHRINPDLLIDL